MSRRALILPALGLLGVVVGVMVWGNLGDNLVYYLTPTEAADQRSEFAGGDRFRLGGQVVAGTLEDTLSGVTFTVGDGATSILVDHTGTPPQLFREEVGVVIEGTWDGDVFRSDVLLVRHDEQYRSPDGEGAYQPPADES